MPKSCEQGRDDIKVKLIYTKPIPTSVSHYGMPHYGMPNAIKISCLCRLDLPRFHAHVAMFGSKHDHGNVYLHFQERSKNRSRE